MPSTFECPYCKSRYSDLISSSWNKNTQTESSIYQCKHCRKMFERELIFTADENSQEPNLDDLNM